MAKNRKRYANRNTKVVELAPWNNEIDEDDDEKELCYHLHDMSYEEIKHVIDSIVISSKDNHAQISENIARYFYILGRLCAIKAINSYRADMSNEISSNPSTLNRRLVEVSSVKNMMTEMAKYWDDGLEKGLYENWSEIPNAVESHVRERTGLDIQASHVIDGYEE